jgi:hypothetical protein
VVWREWVHGTPGVHVIQWSRGLCKLVDVTERTDEEIIADEIGGDSVFTFTRGHDLDEPYIEFRAVAWTRGAVRAVLAGQSSADNGGRLVTINE